MPISRANLEKELVPGLHALVGLAYDDYTKKWQEIFETQTSERSFEEETKLVGFGRAAVKNEGSSVFFDEEAGEAWTARYVMTTYALGFILTEEAIEDELYDNLGARYSKQLGRSMAKTKEYNGANVLNFAFSGSVTGGDGVSLCSASHPTQSGILNSNLAAIGSDLNEATLQNAVIQIGSWVDERGMLIACEPTKLIIPQALEFVAKKVLGSEYAPGTNDNDINALKAMGSIKSTAVNQYLTNPTAWFVKTNVPDGLKHFQRTPLQRKKDGDFNSGNLKYKARERYAFGWTDPLSIFGSTGS